MGTLSMSMKVVTLHQPGQMRYLQRKSKRAGGGSVRLYRSIRMNSAGSLCSDLAKCSKTDWMTPQCIWTMSQTYCMDNPGAFLRQRNGTLIPTQQSIEANLKANTQKAAEGSWRKWSNGLAEYHDVRGFETSGSL